RPIRALHSPSHALDVTERSESRSTVRIAPGDRYPNKDFILHIDVRGETPEAQLLTHRDETGHGYLTLAVQPPSTLTSANTTPKDLFFVVDNSGSMHGAPLAAAKRLITTALHNMNAGDRFTIMRFSDDVSSLSAVPLGNEPRNVEAGVAFVEAMEGMGGTEMLSGVRRALEGVPEPGRIRVVFFLTDGYIGNDAEILNAVQTENEAQARLFSLGVGSSVNRYLLAGMARLGRGEMQVMRHDAEPGPFVDRFYERVRNPVLTNVQVDWGGLPVEDTTPEITPDLFSGQPLLIHGRYSASARGTVTVRGEYGGRAFEQRIPVALPERAERPAVASLWARTKIRDYSDEETQCGECRRDAITEIALEHQLMSKYTAFVAVDRENVARGAEEKLIPVAQRLPLPEGVSRRALGDLSRRNIPPGDPIISIAAPSDARRVTAYFPFGLVKQLHFDTLRELWRGRFLVPAGVPDGDYSVLVVIELADGNTVSRREPFTLDSDTDDFIAFFVDSDGSMSPVSAATAEARQMVELNVDAIEPAAEVYVHCGSLGWNRRLLSPLDDDRILWDGLLVVPAKAKVGSHSVLVVVRDAAGNRFERTLNLNVAPNGSFGESDAFIFTGEYQ
ncbi:MAG: VWA domain-containing protein, partial [Myxococcota bacterium]